MPIFTIDGNIGCGKSTVLEYLHTNYILPIDLEPVKKWQPYLNDMYYHNKGACEFQIRVWLDRCWIQPKQESILIMERSPYFQKSVFIPINKECDRLTEREVNMLNEMYDKSSKIWNPAGYIYLRSKPENCMKRIGHRSRESEESIDKKYIERLHELHEANYYWGVSNGYPMVCVDVENKTVQEIAQNIYQILNFMGVTVNNGKYVYNNSNIQSHNPNSYPAFNNTGNQVKTDEMNSLIAPNLFASFTPRVIHQQPQKEPEEPKSIASKLRDSSKAANMRRKHVKSTTYHINNPINQNNQINPNNQNNQKNIEEYSNYRILKKTSTTSTSTYKNKVVSEIEYEKAFTSEEDDIEHGEYKNNNASTSDLSENNECEEITIV